MNCSKYFLPYQNAWITDVSPLKIFEKSRQIGITYADAYHSVRLASREGARFDVYISSRDKIQARLYIEDCKHWAEILELLVVDLGELVFDPEHNATAHVLQFSNGRRIYSLSSNPNALAGKRGHVKLDEFALHEDQRLLYRIAKPVTTWGGTLSIMSTHRGVGSVFNQLIRGALENGNPMGFSVHSISLQKAVDQGLVERINKKTGKRETRAAFVARLRAGCIDEENWLQEYCCVPADESSAFLSYEMLNACEDRALRLLTFAELIEYIGRNPHSSFYIGTDIGRKQDLFVSDVGEKIGDVTWDRMRIELHDKPFSEMEFELHRLLALPQVKRVCIDASGMGMQFAERAKQRFGYKVEAVTFTPAVKEHLAFGLRRDLEERKLRMVYDDKLRADLRGLKKEVTVAGNIRFVGESEDSHCDRTWAKALRQHAARQRASIFAAVA